jgi:hypothetical protein
MFEGKRDLSKLMEKERREERRRRGLKRYKHK